MPYDRITIDAAVPPLFDERFLPNLTKQMADDALLIYPTKELNNFRKALLKKDERAIETAYQIFGLDADGISHFLDELGGGPLVFVAKENGRINKKYSKNSAYFVSMKEK